MFSAIREFTGSDEFVKIITNGQREDETADEKKKRHKLEAMVFAEGLLPIYGMAVSKKWCEDNKGKVFPQSVSDSCRAYFQLLWLDKHDRLEEEYLLIESLVTSEDKKLYSRFKRATLSVEKAVQER